MRAGGILYTEGCEHGIGAARFPRAALDTAVVALNSQNVYVMAAMATVTATCACTIVPVVLEFTDYYELLFSAISFRTSPLRSGIMLMDGPN